MPPGRAQTASLLSQRKAPFTIREIPAAKMAPADRALLRRAHERLVRQARVFGYQLTGSGWLCDQVQTPDTPGYLMLACSDPQPDGHGASAFSALVARKGSAVFVVPVTYGGAAPWKTAANMKASREIFNHVVPARVAASAIQSNGNWMKLALTFTALVGDHSLVLAKSSSNLKWLRAPEPTIMMRDGASTRTVVFSDVSLAKSVRIWSLTFNNRGRLTAAKAETEPDLQPVKVKGAAPKWEQRGHLPAPVPSPATKKGSPQR